VQTKHNRFTSRRRPKRISAATCSPELSVQRMWEVLRLIQPGAPLESHMQRDMKCDVTCCTVTSASYLGILCLAPGRSEDTRFPDTSMQEHQLLMQRKVRVGSLLFLLQQQPASREKPSTMRRPSWSAH
jgi:hypothetical protein